ncbi:MAG: flagellar export protein FliJ [Pseudomonadota bacterium]|nr:flagellar export protein FliJ [Pseudomonadota bacterium]
MAQSMSQRIEPLQQLAKTREDQAACRLSEAQRRLEEREARLRELSGFCLEYEPRATVTSTQLLLNARLFVTRLREAEAFQSQLTQQARVELEAERKRWLQRHRETSTLDQLADVYRDREGQIERRRGQRVLDDHALRQHQAGDAGEPR